PRRVGREARGRMHAASTRARSNDTLHPAAWPQTGSRFPTRRMTMDEVAFHREPPASIPTLVTAFTGWIDAGEAATGAPRVLGHPLAAEPLAEIDLEDFVD